MSDLGASQFQLKDLLVGGLEEYRRKQHRTRLHLQTAISYDNVSLCESARQILICPLTLLNTGLTKNVTELKIWLH